MKREILVIAISLTTLSIITAISAHVTVVARVEAEKNEVIDNHIRTENWLRLQVAGLSATLQPKPYIRPLENLYLSSGTGYRTDVMGGTTEKLHDGNDFAAPEGTPVRAVWDGIVIVHYVPPDGGQWKGHDIYGGMLEIETEPELIFRYAHLSKTYVHEGDFVEAGDVIGLVGSTGISTASHLHLQVIVSPIKYLEERR